MVDDVALAPSVPSVSYPGGASTVSAANGLKIGRVIGAAHERPGSDMEETFLTSHLAVVSELFRRDVFHDRQMIRRRAEILSHGQNFAADFAQIVHRLEQFRFFFTEAEHHTTFRDDFR